MQLLGLSLASVALPKELLESLVGSLVHPFMHYKPCMSILGRSHRFVASIGAKSCVRPPLTCTTNF